MFSQASDFNSNAKTQPVRYTGLVGKKIQSLYNSTRHSAASTAMAKPTSNRMKVAFSKSFKAASAKPNPFKKPVEFVHKHPRFLKIQERQASYVIENGERQVIPTLDEDVLDPEDPTGLYLKDTKGFMKLRNAQANFM